MKWSEFDCRRWCYIRYLRYINKLRLYEMVRRSFVNQLLYHTYLGTFSISRPREVSINVTVVKEV